MRSGAVAAAEREGAGDTQVNEVRIVLNDIDPGAGEREQIGRRKAVVAEAGSGNPRAVYDTRRDCVVVPDD